jgi:hypothetical protein
LFAGERAASKQMSGQHWQANNRKGHNVVPAHQERKEVPNAQVILHQTATDDVKHSNR